MSTEATISPPAAASPREPVEFYRPGSYNAQDSIGYLMRRSISHLSQQVERAMEPNGLTNAQWVPLLKLYLGQAETVAEVARSCEMDAGAMTRMLDRLEAKGLLRRQRSQEDRRVVKLELTEEGREAAREIPVVLSQVQNALLAGFSQEEWQLLKSFLRRLLDNAHSPQAGADQP
jgi:DNA-binding MarR family transcriptional regulator